MKRTWPILALVAAAGCGPADPVARPQGSVGPLVVPVRTEPWTSAGGGGQVLTSEHYRIYTTSRSRWVLQYLPAYMETAYDHYLRLTGLEGGKIAEPMPIYMMGSRQEWAALTKRVTGPAAQVYLSISAGGYCYRKVCVFWDMGGTGTWAVSGHEGMHQFLAHRMADGLPMWAEEGVCTMAEGHRLERQNNAVRFLPAENPGRLTSLHTTLANGNWVPLPELLPMDAGDALGGRHQRATGYYAQIWALALFIRSRQEYRRGWEAMFADAAAGRLDRAPGLSRGRLDSLGGRRYNRHVSLPLFRQYITEDLQAFETRYKRFCRELAGFE